VIQEVNDKLKEDVQTMEKEMLKIPFEVMSEDDLKDKINELGFDHFVDAHFPPRDISIYNKAFNKYPYKKIIHWRRPHEFMKKEPTIFEDDIDPNDIKQGFLGNCWFLCAVACLAERPALVRRLFITKEYNEEGIYKLRI
jgi:hypothetical protein